MKNTIIIIAIGAIIIFIFRNRIKNLLGIEIEIEQLTSERVRAVAAETKRAREVTEATARRVIMARKAMLAKEAAGPRRIRLPEHIRKALEYRQGRVDRGIRLYTEEEGRRRIGPVTHVTPERASATAETARRVIMARKAMLAKEAAGPRRIRLPEHIRKALEYRQGRVDRGIRLYTEEK